MTNSPVFHIRCLMEGISPPVWRSLQVPAWLTFGQLAVFVRVAFGWQPQTTPSCRMEIGDRILTFDAADMDARMDGWKLRDLFVPGLRMVLSTIYGANSGPAGVSGKTLSGESAGGSWAISLQVVGLGPAEPGVTAPRCIGGERAAPPEELDGPEGYQRLLRNPKQRGLWNPERFDLVTINEALRDAAMSVKTIRTPKRPVAPLAIPEGPGFFLKDNDVQFDLHAYYQELETAYWLEPCPEKLADALSSLQREELLGLCMVYGLPVEPVFRRTQLESLLRTQLPEAIRLQVPYLDDRQYGLLRQVVDSPDGQIRFARADMLFSPYELYYFRDRLLLFPRLNDTEGELYMLPEIREALKMDPMQSLSRTQLQNANRRRILCGMFQYYGAMTLEQLQNVLSELLGESVDMDTLVVDIQELQDFFDAVTIGEVLVMHTALDPMAAQELWERQQQVADLPYRKLTLETLDLAGDWMFVEATHEAEILISFLEGRYALNTGAAEGIAWELMHRFRWGEPLEKALQMAGEALKHPDAAAERRFAELVALLWLHAPAWRFKGWSPAEVRALSEADTEGWMLMETDEYATAMSLIVDDKRTSPFPNENAQANPRHTQTVQPHERKRSGRVIRFPGESKPE